jgi:hypothetical protein
MNKNPLDTAALDVRAARVYDHSVTLRLPERAHYLNTQPTDVLRTIADLVFADVNPDSRSKPTLVRAILAADLS